MNYTIVNCDQRTPEWFEARRGRVTGSVAGDITAKGRGAEEAVKRRDLRFRLALERATGKYLECDRFVSGAMKRGIELEPEARAVYEAISGQMVSEVGFVSSVDHWRGYSPDAVVMDGDRIAHVVELKCPEWSAHWDYLHTADIGKAYLMQICHGFLVTECDTVSWMSYNPDYPEKLQHAMVSFERAEMDESIGIYVEALEKFEREVAAMVEEIAQRAA